MLTWRFAAHLNRSLAVLVGLVIEETEVAYLKLFPCVVVKKTFQVTCKFSDSENKVDLILTRAPSRSQKISMILQFTPLKDQISVLGRVVVPIVDVECLKKCTATVKVKLSRFQKPRGELASVWHRLYSGCLENSYNLAPVSRLLTTVCKTTRPVKLRS